MSLRILFVTATDLEADILREIPGIIPVAGGFRLGNCEINRLVTGVGSISTAWSMKQWLSSNPKPDLSVNIGIAGSYKKEIGIGKVVMPVSDCFADMGIETEKGFLTLSEAGLSDPDKFPFRNGLIKADNEFVNKAEKYLTGVRAVTVNTVSGSVNTIKRIIDKYDPDIETMEGAAFFYVSAMERIPCLAIRSVSNRVEPRDSTKWRISEAVKNLSEKIEEIILILE
ncbi:MAG TPA: futalosine hydrolase [Bacteroidales bacterium]|nr:futalosine hydrolase [Bacteroidales bacterium]